MRNLHLDILRQFHMQEVHLLTLHFPSSSIGSVSLRFANIVQMETSSAMKLILENQAELMKEVQLLRRETQQLRQLL